MGLTQAQLTALVSEINTDPKAVGYAGKSNVQCATLLNTPGLVASDPKIPSGVIPTYRVMGAIATAAEYAAALTTQTLRDQFLAYIAAGSIDTGNTAVRAVFLAMFPTATAPTTHANLVALVDRAAARAETLFGVGTVVDQSDVSSALGRSV